MSFVTTGAGKGSGDGASGSGPSSARAQSRPTLNAHFARQERLLEDQRHAAMLRGIANRPATARTGAFASLSDHDFYSRTLAVRKRAERSEREFARQKENLLLLQRLQQIECHEHPSRTARGRNFALDCEEHQRKHDEGLARMRVRPRLGSSLVFRAVDRVSPLTPRNRVQWDGRAKLQPYHDSTWERDADRHTARPSTAAGSKGSSKLLQQRDDGTRRAMEAERAAIEAELQRRWDVLESGPRGHSNLSAASSRRALLEEQLGPDEEEVPWSRALDPFMHAAPLPVAAPAFAHNLQYFSESFAATVHATGASHDPESLAALESARRRAIRARYVAEDEDDVDLDDEEQQQQQSLSAAGAAAAPVPLASLYALAMHPQLSAGDAEIEAYRVMQYAQLHGLPAPPPPPAHAPRPPLHQRSGSRSARSSRRPPSATASAAALASVASSSAVAVPPAGAYDSADAHWHAHPSSVAQWHGLSQSGQEGELESLLDALNGQDELGEPAPNQQQQRPGHSRPGSAMRRPPNQPHPFSSRGARTAAHARSYSASSLQQGAESASASAAPTSRASFAPTAKRSHARTVSLAVGPSSRHARHSSSSAGSGFHPRPPGPAPPSSTLPADAAVAVAMREQKFRAESERQAEAEAERYFASLSNEFSSEHPPRPFR